MRVLSITSIFTLSTIGVLPAAALDRSKAITQYVHEVWQAKDGLAASAVRDVAQTPDGYLWLATQAGLVRFDGVRFKLFRPADSPGLPSAVILCLEVGRDGELWLGTDGGGVARWKDGRFTSPPAADAVPRQFVWSLHQARDGTLWLGSGGGGLHRLANGTFSRVGPARGRVEAIFEDREGRLWVGTQRGLMCLDGGQTHSYTTADGLGSDLVHAIHQARSGDLWIGTTGGLTRRRGGRFHTFTRADGLPSDNVRALLEDRDGTLWVGTEDGGLARERDGRFEVFASRVGLSDDSVLSLAEDREGSLWIGTRNGLNRLRDGALTAYTTREGLPTDVVRTLATGPDGSIWIATDGRGLARLRDGAMTVYDRRDGLPEDRVKLVHVARDGAVWVVTSGNVLVRMADGRVESYRGPRKISVIAEDEEGFLLGTVARLARFREGRFSLYGGSRELGHIYSIFRDRRGRRWFATSDGLAVETGDDDFRWVVPSRDGEDQMYSVHEDVDGRLWVATRTGLLRVVGDDATRLTTRHGLVDDVIFHVLEDGHGYFWMNTSRGIARVSRADLNAVAEGRKAAVDCAIFDTTDGMRSAEARAHVQPSAAQGPDGRLWFITEKGVVMAHPDRLPRNTQVPSVVIEEVHADGQELGRGMPLRLTSGTRRLEIRYTALSLLAPPKVRFQYRLDGYDQGWVDARNSRVATYGRLPPGEYMFRVKAANNDGVWNEVGASVPVSVMPRFHQTAWFRSLIGVAVLGLAWGVYRLRMRHLTARFGLVLEERSRLAREFHDTLEAGFVGIKLQLDVTAATLDAQPDLAREHLATARSMVAHSMTEARRSIWDLRAQALERGDLASALARVARELNADGAMRTDLRVLGTPSRLSAVAENGLLRIGQEAITNAFKHARAHHLVVELLFDERRLQMRVRDDGQGFEAAAGSAAGQRFGLLGMRERADRLGADLRLTSGAGRGTEVVVDLPLGPA